MTIIPQIINQVILETTGPEMHIFTGRVVEKNRANIGIKFDFVVNSFTIARKPQEIQIQLRKSLENQLYSFTQHRIRITHITQKEFKKPVEVNITAGLEKAFYWEECLFDEGYYPLMNNSFEITYFFNS